jgi:hypothetical protein
VEGFADRGYGLCDGAAMVEGLKGQSIGAWSGSESAGAPIGRTPGGGRSRNMQTDVLADSGSLSRTRQRIVRTPFSACHNPTICRYRCCDFYDASLFPRFTSTLSEYFWTRTLLLAWLNLRALPGKCNRGTHNVCRSGPGAAQCLKSAQLAQSRSSSQSMFPVRQSKGGISLRCSTVLRQCRYYDP